MIEPFISKRFRTRRGFAIYLAFLVTTVLFFLVMGGQDIVRLALDQGRSTALEIISYQAADGGLERGLARLRRSFEPFDTTYVSPLGPFRRVEVQIMARPSHDGFMLIATATVFDGNRPVARRRLERHGVLQTSGRNGIGQFVEAS